MLVLVVALLGMVLVPFLLMLAPLALWFMVPLVVLLTAAYAVKVIARRLAPLIPPSRSS